MFTVLTGADVYAPAPLGRADVLISQGRILAIGDTLAVDLPSVMNDVEVIDCTSLILTPGVIDGHCHPLGGGDLAGPSGRRGPVDSDLLIRNGITSVVGVLAADYHGRTIESLALKGRELEERGVGFRFYTGSVSSADATATGTVGGDVRLIDSCAGLKLAIAEPLCSATMDDRVTASVDAVRAARVAGKTPRVHLHVGARSTGLDELYEPLERTSLPASMFQPTHINRSDPDLMSAAIPFVELGGWLDLTATLPLGGGLPNRLSIADALTRLLDTGVPLERITCSSDGNVTLPVRNDAGEVVGSKPADIDELTKGWRVVVEAGLLPLENALTLVTSNPARALGMFPDRGGIEPGSIADLVGWNRDLEPQLVAAGGVLHDFAEMRPTAGRVHPQKPAS